MIARSKNLAKAGLMSPPPELSIFSIVKSPSFVGSYRVGAVKGREGKNVTKSPVKCERPWASPPGAPKHCPVTPNEEK